MARRPKGRLAVGSLGCVAAYGPLGAVPDEGSTDADRTSGRLIEVCRLDLRNFKIAAVD